MALRNLVLEGDPLLRKTSRPVDEITPRIIKLLDDMADTMYYGGRGIGIAAPQVGVLRRVFIVDVGDEHGSLKHQVHRQITKAAFLFRARHVKSRDLHISRSRLRTATATNLNWKLMVFSQDVSAMRTIT